VLVNVAYGVTDAIGDWTIPLPIPSNIAPAPLYWQVIQVDAGELWSSDRRTIVPR
jgi:hypothetical protein